MGGGHHEPVSVIGGIGGQLATGAPRRTSATFGTPAARSESESPSR